jgi:hypothetical protein
VFEASIEMSFSREQHNMLEVSMIDMGIHSEEPLEDDLDNVHKVFGERYSQLAGKYFLIIQLILNPGH